MAQMTCRKRRFLQIHPHACISVCMYVYLGDYKRRNMGGGQDRSRSPTVCFVSGLGLSWQGTCAVRGAVKLRLGGFMFGLCKCLYGCSCSG